MAYARDLLDAQRYAEASAQLQVVTREKPDYPEGWLVLGSLQLQDNQLARGADLAAALRRTGQPGRAERRRPAAACPRPTCRSRRLPKNARISPAPKAGSARSPTPQELVQAQTRRASLLARQGKLDEARQLIRKLPERKPDDARIKLMAEVNLLRDQKEYQQRLRTAGAGRRRNSRTNPSCCTTRP